MTGHRPLRRGLPRIEGGEPWPPGPPEPTEPAEIVEAAETTEPAAATPPAQAAPTTSGTAAMGASAVGTAPVDAAPRKRSGPARIVGRTLGLIVAAGVVVLAARGVTTLTGVPEFLHRYPGTYRPTTPPEPGFPAWARWSHYLNAFFMILIIRTGWQVRTQRKPPAYWSSRRTGKKFSLTLWTHLAVDCLWLLNGLAFVVLLLVSGHWARIVPSSWEVFPNAASALLQYLTLNWPVEQGWENYNSLQQLLYFLVVFVAAPLALITGLRMSAWWPTGAQRLNRVYPVAAARAVHLPTMFFFVGFVLVHVFLVLATGARRNLNHMFIGNDTAGWAGFVVAVIGVLVIVAAVAALRPLFVAPVARLFGGVSSK